MKLLAGLFALALACLGAPALAEDSDKLMKALDFEELRGIAEELDYYVIEEGVDTDGDFYFEVESEKGLRFTIYGANCDDDAPARNCMDLNAVGTFSLDAEADVPAVMNSISYAFMKVYRAGENIKIARHVTFHGGITRANVKHNLRTFGEIAHLIRGKLDKAEVLAN